MTKVMAFVGFLGFCFVSTSEANISFTQGPHLNQQQSPLHQEQYDIGIKLLSADHQRNLRDLAETEADQELAMIPWTPWSASLSSGCVFSGCTLSGCIFSGCGVSGCGGSACIASGCAGSICTGSVCGGSTCAGSSCSGSVCVGSDCNGSVCVGSACNGSVCQGSGCSGSACSGSNCTNSLCSNSGCDTCPPDITSIQNPAFDIAGVAFTGKTLQIATMTSGTYSVQYRDQSGNLHDLSVSGRAQRITRATLHDAVEIVSVRLLKV